MKLEKLYIAAVIVLTLLGAAYVVLTSPRNTDAGSPTFVRTAVTSGSGAFASSSPTYMGAGRATTTLTYDAYSAQGTGEVNGQLTWTMNVQTAASSTNTTYCRAIETSNDGVDWYPFSATSTATIFTGLSPQCWLFASTTNSLAAGATATSSQAIQVPILERYTRVLFYIPPGSQDGALWAESIGVKQRSI